MSILTVFVKISSWGMFEFKVVRNFINLLLAINIAV